MQQLQWSSKDPRRIICTTGPIQLLAMRYKCNVCKFTISGSEPEVLEGLPKIIRDQFPAILTHKSGVSADLFRLIPKLAVLGLSFSAMARIINETSNEELDRTHLLYLLYCQSKSKEARRPNPFSKDTGLEYEVKPYERPEPCSVSSNFITTIFMAYFLAKAEFLRSQMQSVVGSILKVDHTFKVAKVLVADGHRPFEALWTCINEYGQILTQAFVGTKAFDEIKPAFEKLVHRHTVLGAQQPEVIYTDICCQERGQLSMVMKGIKVRLDPFHFLQRFKAVLSAKSDLSRPFLNALSNAIFKVDEVDLRSLATELEVAKTANKRVFYGRPISASSQVGDFPRKFLKRFCRYTIPPPQELSQRIGIVMATFADKIDSNGRPFWNSSLDNCRNRQHKHVRDECLSDPLPVDQMHFMTLSGDLRSKRGTSPLESYHARKNLAVSGLRCNPDLILALLAVYNDRFNHSAAIKAGLSPDVGHFDLELAKDLNTLSSALGLEPPFPDLKIIQPNTSEFFGIYHSEELQRLQTIMNQPEPIFAEESDDEDGDGVGSFDDEEDSEDSDGEWSDDREGDSGWSDIESNDADESNDEDNDGGESDAEDNGNDLITSGQVVRPKKRLRGSLALAKAQGLNFGACAPSNLHEKNLLMELGNKYDMDPAIVTAKYNEHVLRSLELVENGERTQ